MDGDKITNPQRITAALPTIKHAIEKRECDSLHRSIRKKRTLNMQT